MKKIIVFVYFILLTAVISAAENTDSLKKMRKDTSVLFITSTDIQKNQNIKNVDIKENFLINNLPIQNGSNSVKNKKTEFDEVINKLQKIELNNNKKKTITLLGTKGDEIFDDNINLLILWR